MTMSATLTQSQTALLGTPTTFILAVANSDAVSTVNVQTIGINITGPDGALCPPSMVGGPYAPTGLGVTAVGGTQFNVAVSPSSSVYFPLTVAFYGSDRRAATAISKNQFLMSASVQTSDGNYFNTPQLEVDLNQSWHGVVGVTPPGTVPTFGALNFSSAANSALF